VRNLGALAFDASLELSDRQEQYDRYQKWKGRKLMEHNGSDTVGDGSGRIRTLATQMGERAESAKEQAAAAAQRTAAKLGEQMTTAAGRIRETGPRIEAAVHSTAETLANKLERGGVYFKEKQYEDLVGKAAAYIRQHPVPSLIVGVVTGMLLARKVRR
jgi:hypothetical protein